MKRLTNEKIELGVKVEDGSTVAWKQFRFQVYCHFSILEETLQFGKNIY